MCQSIQNFNPLPPFPWHLAILVSLGGIDLRLTFKRPEHSVKATILSRKSEIYKAIHCQQYKFKILTIKLTIKFDNQIRLSNQLTIKSGI